MLNLGWVDFAKSDRDMVLSVLRQLTEPGAVDELGIGTIRDRVDKMENVQKLDENRSTTTGSFDLADYSKKVFGMFGGEEAEVKLRVSNQLVGAVIDRFGKDISMRADGDSHFVVSVRVALSPVFYGWLFQFGDLCDVLSPQSLKDELKGQAEKILSRLEK